MKNVSKLLWCVVFLVISQIVAAQLPSEFREIKQNPKPDFVSYLHGVRNWNFGDFIYNGQDMSDAQGGDFCYAYVIQEVKNFMKATIPDATHGENHNFESTTQLQVDVNVRAVSQLKWDGRYVWYINCSLDFSPEPLPYYYSFSIPQISVTGNDFENHSLYNALLDNVNKHVINYLKYKEIHLGKIKTGYDENRLKQTYDSGISHPFEGIYEATDLQDVGKYKLGAKYVNGVLYLIFLAGAYMWDDWQEGELKAELEPTATPNIYKAKWYNIYKDIRDAYITFESNCMKVLLNGEQVTYLKMYPTSTSRSIPSENEIWSGTGFALNNGYIATNYHVVENAKSIKVKGIRGNINTEYNATVISTDKYNDLAIIKINDHHFNGFGTIPYRIKTSTSEVGEEVFVLGYPLVTSMGDEIKLTTGVISSKTGFQGDVSSYQMSAPTQPGNSGGPLFDKNGNLIGIVNAKHREAENASYAIKASYLNILAESASNIPLLPTNNSVSGMSLSNKVKSLKNFVFLITCSNSSTGTSAYSGSVSSSANTVNYPFVRNSTAERAKIKSVYIGRDYTAVEITSNNQSGNGYYQWCNIDRNTYIMVNGTRYTMTKAEGIKIAPDKTYFSYAGQEITFTLYFPPIPTSATEMDLIESANSSWKWYGIQLK